jgi:hypothetical protein
LIRHAVEVAQVIIATFFAVQSALKQLHLAFEHSERIPQIMASKIEKAHERVIVVNSEWLFVSMRIHRQLPSSVPAL